MVRTYSLARDGEKKLSEHFRVREFACHDGSDKILISDETVRILEAIRTYFGQPVTITSGYRTAAYNASPKVGGAKNSQHVKGTAADIKVEGVPSWAVAGYLEANFRSCSIGYYSSWVHVDTRGYRALWKDYGSNTKGTFGIGNNYQRYEYIAPAKQEEDPEMTIDEIKKEILKDKEFCAKLVDEYRHQLQDNDAAKWSADARSWATKNGLIQGGSGSYMWEDFLTREQAAAMLQRYDRLNADDGK